MFKMSVPRVVVAMLILLAGFLGIAGCTSPPSDADEAGKKAAPVTTDRSVSK